jgi:hypothetical protein
MNTIGFGTGRRKKEEACIYAMDYIVGVAIKKKSQCWNISNAGQASKAKTILFQLESLDTVLVQLIHL